LRGHPRLKSVVAVKVADGKPIWSFPWVTLYDVNAADPVIAGGKAFHFLGYDHGCALLDISGAKPALLCRTRTCATTSAVPSCGTAAFRRG